MCRNIKMLFNLEPRATDEEIQEAVHYAKMTVGWSVYLNGIREDYDQFVVEMSQMRDYLLQKTAAPAST